MMISRNIAHPGNKEAVKLLFGELEAIVGSAALRPFEYGDEDYFNVESEVVGANTEDIVVVGAHFDSTAAKDKGSYLPATSPAPGADDNLSGVLAVIMAAQIIVGLSEIVPPSRSIRLVLFNAEEEGLKGSKKYADALEENGLNVHAMFAMDMIGWHPGDQPEPHKFEIHGAGTSNTEYNKVSQSSGLLTDLVADTANLLASSTLVPEKYPLAGCSDDPATDRSDHAPFQVHAWPACLVTEDLFDETCPGQQAGNPNYHTSKDEIEELDIDYIANIARVVAWSAWLVAND